jgi:SAM-dependent methyltransferase
MDSNLNRYLTEEDLQYSIQRRDAENFVENFPHRDLWYKDDAIMKWFSIIRTFESLVKTNTKKVVDLGSGESPVSHYLASLGNDVTGVDIGHINHLVKQSLVKMVLNDAWIFLEEQKSKSIDVFLDSCAVTHFCDHGKAYKNQWQTCFNEVYRVLKSGGYFIISTDVNPDSDIGEFISPEKIIEYAIENGLTLWGEFNFLTESLYVPQNYDWPISHLVFKK